MTDEPKPTTLQQLIRTQREAWYQQILERLFPPKPVDDNDKEST